MKHRILLADDEPDILEFIRYNLMRAGYEVYTAANGEEALKQAEAHHPHLILLDVMMPVMDGLTTCRTLRADPQFKNTMILFLSALSEEESQLAGYEVGADDYIAKPIKLQILMSRIQAILKRIEKDPEPTIRLDRDRHEVTAENRTFTLPRKEFALLDLLFSSPGKLFTREEIYTRIWGNEVVVGDRTIDVHIRKLRQKIGEKHIVTIKGVGYKFVK